MHTVQTCLYLLQGYEKSTSAAGAITPKHAIMVDFGLCEVLTERNVPMRPTFLTYEEVRFD